MKAFFAWEQRSDDQVPFWIMFKCILYGIITLSMMVNKCGSVDAICKIHRTYPTPQKKAN